MVCSTLIEADIISTVDLSAAAAARNICRMTCAYQLQAASLVKLSTIHQQMLHSMRNLLHSLQSSHSHRKNPMNRTAAKARHQAAVHSITTAAKLLADTR